MVNQNSATLTLTFPSDRETVITRTFNAPRRLVFDAWTKPEHVRHWYGPSYLTMTSCEIDLRPGGAWRYVVQGPDGSEYGFSGVYREIVAPERLVYTEGYEAVPGTDYLVTTTFDEQDGKTTLTSRLLYKSQEHRDGHVNSGMESGMRETLDRLDEHLVVMATAKHDLFFRRVFDAPIGLVWKAWTEPEHVMQWWGPNYFTCPSAEIDFREGGTSLVCMRAPTEFGGQDMYSTWVYTKIVPLERIEYIHNLADKDGNKVDPVDMGLPADFPQDQRHVVTFKALGDNKTELTVTEYGWIEGHMMEMSLLGMNQCLDKMAASFAEA